jgi:hypothetical protein
MSEEQNELVFKNETEFFNHIMVYQDSMKPSDVGLAGNIVLIGYKLLEEQCPSCRNAMAQQLRILYANLPKYYKNHPEKKNAFFKFLEENINLIKLYHGDIEIGIIER